VSLGNDVVDLANAETRLDGLHPRFAERVFTPAERRALQESGDRHVLHWALWAAKESAYKALRRADPRAIFAPRAFEVDLPAHPVPGAVMAGRVRHGGRSHALEVALRGEVLHAVAWDPAGPLTTTIRAAVAGAGRDPGTDARRLAARGIGAALGVDPGGVRIAGRPPVASRAGRPLDLVVSLSHHGRFVAFAWAGIDPGGR
jgi:phosphopantetheinyl transferase (holo-ACP synthase)